MNDPWAGPVAEPPKITADHVRRILELIADYTAVEATDLIQTLNVRNATPGQCSACKQVGRHSDTCVTQGRD
jgi:hypothetical protein